MNRTHFSASQARQVIAQIKRDAEALKYPDPARTAPPAEAAQYLNEMNAGASALSTLEHNANLAHLAPRREALTREEADGRIAQFRKMLSGSGAVRDEKELDDRCRWFESTLQIEA